tara:strand:+ start:300 stop:527 length:228 start_codon:yes stop_codon:yes gene_type:complete
MKKGFEAEISLEKTPNFKDIADKPLNNRENQNKKVDINILKARAQQIELRESRKNVFIFIFFLVLLGMIGIYLSI